MYRASNLTYSKLFPAKFNQIWDSFIKTRYYFSIFTLKYGEICIIIRIKYRWKCIMIHIVSLIRNDIQPYLLMVNMNDIVQKCLALIINNFLRTFSQEILHPLNHWSDRFYSLHDYNLSGYVGFYYCYNSLPLQGPFI